MDYEVKADPLDGAFDVAAAPVIRPALATAATVADPARTAFVEGYLRHGSDVELKSFSGAVPADGGYALPREIDARIDALLSLAAGQPDTLLGYPVVESEDMPEIAANTLPIAFGNFRAGYLVAERSETAILRDPFTNKPYVNFYATKRLGGAVANSQAIKLLKIAAA